MARFVELIAKTNFSFLSGASHPEEMVQMAHGLGYAALGIADYNGVYGAARSHVAAKQLKLPLILGSEISVEKEQKAVLLAKTREGYGNLCELLTHLHCETNGAVLWQHVMKYGEELFCLLPAQGLENYPVAALKTCFGTNLYLFASSFLDGTDRLEVKRAEHLSREHGLPCIASNQPLFHSPLRKPLHDVLTCIRHTCPIEKAGFRLLPNAERALKPISEIVERFADHPEWIENTLRIAEGCRFSLDEITYHYPSEWIPEGETGNSFLAKLTWEGAKQRYGGEVPPEVAQQIRKELDLIQELAYADYFLTIWDIVQFAKQQKILYQGRGSAANSLVCYLLGITAIDPVRMELLFERFISRERKEPPDIDIDFEHERREEVIQYIYDHYGRHRAAISAEVICFRRRSSLREVAKVFQIPLSLIEKLLVITHRRTFSEVPQEEIFGPLTEIAPEIPLLRLKQFLALANELFGFPRHLGTHVGGFVLCHDKLSRNIPIQKAAMPGRTIVQWDKNDLDALGFVRVDILGLGILTCLRKTLHDVKRVHGQDYTLATIPAEDPKVYDSFCAADTVGVFQIESRAQMNMLPRLKPRNFFDLVVEISLVRPGPIQGQMVHPYLKRRAKKETVIYPHPELEAILHKTYGVPLFQEQIMKMAMVVAGFSGGEADELRRAMGTWRSHGKNRLAQMGEKFRAGLMKKGIDKAFSDRIFSQIEGFAEYGFPESHAASFSILAYTSGYLRLYYPDAYLCGILNAQPMGFYATHTLVHDGQRHGVKVLEIDVQQSRWDNHLPAKGAVRLGYREIHGLAEKTARAIESARSDGPFQSLLDLVKRTKEKLAPRALTKRDLFFLAAANALECLGYPRRDALWEIQALPLQDSHILPHPEGKLPLPEETGWEKISGDYEAQGVSLYQHPMAYFRDLLNSLQVLSSPKLKPPISRFLHNRRKVRVAGIVISRQMPPTATGVLFITLEDEFGFVNLVIWNPVFQKYREVLLTQSFLVCEGEVQKPDDAEIVHVIVESASPLLDRSVRKLAPPSHDFR